MSLSDPVVFGELETAMKLWDSFKPLFALFTSSTDTSKVVDDTVPYIADSIDGGYNELLKCGQQHTVMGTESLETLPYTTRLRPVTPISIFSSFKKIYLTKVRFDIIDSTLKDNPDQDSAVLQEITDSLTSPNDALVQSRFRLGQIGGYLPNFFRPTIKTKTGVDVFKTMATSNYGKKNNKGDLSIGPMLPYEYTPPFPINLGKLTNDPDALQVFAGAGQIVIVSGTKHIQRYPIQAYLEMFGVEK